MQDYEILNVYINNKKVSLKDLKLRIDNGYADLFLEVYSEWFFNKYNTIKRLCNL